MQITPAAYNSSGLRILIVEDDEDHAFLESDILVDELDCIITLVANKAEFLDVELAEIDIVLLDFNQPHTNGKELLGMIREKTNIPIIIITAQKEMKIAIDTLKDGANDFLEKSPNTITLLPKIVRKVYANYQRSMEIASKAHEQDVLKTKVETLRQILTTLAHYINNSTTMISGYAQLAQQHPSDSQKAEKLIAVSLKETQKITYVLEELEGFVNKMEIKTTNYVDIPNAMFAIEDSIKRKMKELEEAKNSPNSVSS